MKTYELEPDVTRWGLHQLDIGTLTNTGYCSTITRYDQDSSQVEYVKEGFSENANVENDEAIARALQEEFTRIESFEVSGLSNVVEEHLQASVLAQDLLGPSERHHSSGHENDKKAADNPGRKMEDADPSINIMEKADDHGATENDVAAEIEIFGSCSSPREQSSNVEDLLHTSHITYEFALDGGYCSTITRYDQELGQVEYVREGFSENANVENDEAIARALQEEFTQIDSFEVSRLSNAVEDHLQASVLAHDWLGPSERHHSSGHENDKKAADNPGRKMEDACPSINIMEKADDHRATENDVAAEIEIFGSCSSPREQSSNVEDLLHTLDIKDEFALDGEVGKRFNQMVPVPLTSDPGMYEGYVPMAYKDYLKKMSKTVEWGDHVTLQAAADWDLLAFYGLPLPHTLVELAAGPPTSLPEGVEYEFQTLPVDARAVADGDTMTVYVSTADPRESSCVPSDVQLVAVHRLQARSERNYVMADALQKIIVDAGYRVLNIQNEEILARKYRIRLRGIDAPEGEMPYGEEAKEELTKIVQGKCLRVLVYGEDRYGRCVGDIYCNGKFVQELMLKKGLAWHYTAYDKRPELEKWEK